MNSDQDPWMRQMKDIKENCVLHNEVLTKLQDTVTKIQDFLLGNEFTKTGLAKEIELMKLSITALDKRIGIMEIDKKIVMAISGVVGGAVSICVTILMAIFIK
jgi:hypothetical protein